MGVSEPPKKKTNTQGAPAYPRRAHPWDSSVGEFCRVPQGTRCRGGRPRQPGPSAVAPVDRAPTVERPYRAEGHNRMKPRVSTLGTRRNNRCSSLKWEAGRAGARSERPPGQSSLKRWHPSQTPGSTHHHRAAATISRRPCTLTRQEVLPTLLAMSGTTPPRETKGPQRGAPFCE